MCEKVILGKIISNVNKEECFSILTVETTDISGIEQFSLYSLHWKSQQWDNIKKKGFKLVPVKNVTGKGLWFLTPYPQNFKSKYAIEQRHD